MRPIDTLVTKGFECCMLENMGKLKGQPTSAEEAPFEEVMDRLQTVVDQLEEGDLPLEQSLAMFEEGVRLSRAGAKRLDEAERRVEELLAAGDELQTSPLEASEAGEQ
jgi:exodeoxyribonuclease VII small subunit